jgi:hypothetical protein
LERRPLPLDRTRLAVAFAEPVYERLCLADRERERHLLAFVRAAPEPIREHLSRLGATRQHEFAAECYAEIWELPEEWSDKPGIKFLELDQGITSALRVLDGRFPADAGYWHFGDRLPKKATSRLLQAAQDQGRSRAR